MKTTCAVVVTYNRVNYLKKCLNHILKQSTPVNHIVVIDNYSTDDTQDFMSNSINEKIFYYRMDKNLGGAGGFAEGIKRAYKLGDEFLWLMDDDTIPQKEALSELLAADYVLDGNWSFLSSNIRWINDDIAVMNELTTSKNWAQKISLNLVGVQTGTFVSILISRRSVAEYGLPLSQFFIWGDDTEYTLRISQHHQGYFVAKSIAIHEMKNNSRNSIEGEKDEKRLDRYYYSFRNSYYIARREKRSAVYLLKSLNTSRKVLIGDDALKLKIKKLGLIYKGLFKGKFFNPEIKFID